MVALTQLTHAAGGLLASLEQANEGERVLRRLPTGGRFMQNDPIHRPFTVEACILFRHWTSKRNGLPFS